MGKDAWGASSSFKRVPQVISDGRPGFKTHLERVRVSLPPEETRALKEVDQLSEWAERLPYSQDHFGLIHYDFELDNLVWKDGGLSLLDFDEAANYWYEADIAYALRGLFEEEVDLDLPEFKAFMSGYCEARDPNLELLNQLESFLKWHHLRSFAEFLRVVDLDVTESDPAWLVNLHGKLSAKIESYRKSFEEMESEI